MLTLEQLYNLGLSLHTDIFSGITLPENSPLDRTVLVNTIIEKCGLNIPMYADPFIMSSAVNIWSARNQYTFEHVGKIFAAQYSPIENKDYTESTTVVRDRDLTDNTDISNNSSENVSTTGSTTGNNQRVTAHSGTDTTTDENTTSAYNASDYQPDNKTVSTLQHGESIADTSNSTISNTGSNAKQTAVTISDDKSVTEDETTTTTSHQHGNIGVTSNYDLQKSEYALLSEYNPYTFIAGLFENELTLFVY